MIVFATVIGGVSLRMYVLRSFKAKVLARGNSQPPQTISKMGQNMELRLQSPVKVERLHYDMRDNPTQGRKFLVRATSLQQLVYRHLATLNR